jgi:DNA modification methylase
MCGDCINQTHIDTLLEGNMADLVVTDPPYNMAYEGAGKTPDDKRKTNKILNDKMPEEDFERFLTAVNGSIYSSLKNGASFYIFYKELGSGVFITALKAAALTFKQELIWVKNQLVLGGSKYQNMYEPCLFGCKGKSIKNWYSGRKERSVIEHIDLMDEKELRLAIKELLANEETDIIRVEKNKVNDLHPTMKPIKLLAKLIKNSSKQNDIVLDLFGGSGSTLMACEQLDRSCYMMELDTKYVDVIIDRWEKYTGKKAILLNRNENVTG